MESTSKSKRWPFTINIFYIKGCSIFMYTKWRWTINTFFSGNLHAIYFACPIGTHLVAVADGIVIESNDQNTLTGIAMEDTCQTQIP